MTNLILEHVAQLDTLTLDSGDHVNFNDGCCAEEAIHYITEHGALTDTPNCVSPVLRIFTVCLNDTWEGEWRQKLLLPAAAGTPAHIKTARLVAAARAANPHSDLPADWMGAGSRFLIPQVGTAGDGQDEARSFLALDWLIRIYTPAWLDLAGLATEAQALRDLRRIVDSVAAQEAGPVARAARDAAGVAAGDAAGDAAGVAAGAAAGVAAGDAAGDAAWAAARTTARDAARAAAWAAAWAAARNAAGAAARNAAWAAARNALRPTVEALHMSALDLLDRMIDPSAVTK